MNPQQDIRVLFSTRVVRLFAYGSLSVMLALYLAALGLTEPQIGLLLTLTLVGDTAISLWLTTRADRFGRRRTLIIGAILRVGAGLVFAGFDSFLILLIAAITFLVFAIPYFYLINTGNFWLAVIAEVIGFGFVFGFGYGAIPTFYTENFPTRYRASGASAGYQISQVYGGGLIPIVAGYFLKAYGVKEAYLYIGGLVMIYAVLAIYAIWATPETRDVDLEA